MSARAWQRRRWRSRTGKLARWCAREDLGTPVAARFPGGLIVELTWHPADWRGWPDDPAADPS